MEPAAPSQLTARRTRRLALPLVSAICALLGGGSLRLWMLHKFYEVSDDSKIYGGLAKNLLLHARYAVTDGSGVLHDTLIRLPGYPLFLAACFRIFGMENYFSATCVQIAADLVACMLVAWLAWRSSRRMAAFQATLWLACLCPFTAIYSAEPLTESLTILCIALTMWALTRFQDWGTWLSALAFTFAVTFAALLRPDGALVGVAFVVPFVRALRARLPPREWHSFHGAPLDYSIIRKAIVCLLLALAPFAAWTVRNGLNFHVFQPVAPRYATDPGEPTWPGFQSWMKTWCLDFTSTSQIYWNMPGSPLDINQMPGRAFDNPGQREETAQLFSDYAANGDELSLALDARFAQLAADRIDINPFRYYIWLPLSRVADMLFRPRIENLPIDLDWWVYSHHWAETRFSWFYVVLNAFYFMLAVVGLFYRPRLWRWMLLYFILRCALLGTIEAPEARYTIEFFPMIFVLAGVTICRIVPEKETAADQFAAVTHH